jgi:hypothetical protein
MSQPTTAAEPKVTWRAGNDRIAHAHIARPKPEHTACGSEIVQERLAWPHFRKCMVCLAALEPVPEGEARLMWGGR